MKKHGLLISLLTVAMVALMSLPIAPIAPTLDETVIFTEQTTMPAMTSASTMAPNIFNNIIKTIGPPAAQASVLAPASCYIAFEMFGGKSRALNAICYAMAELEGWDINPEP